MGRTRIEWRDGQAEALTLLCNQLVLILRTVGPDVYRGRPQASGWSPAYRRRNQVCHPLGNSTLLVASKPWIHRQRQNFPSNLFGDGKTSLGVAEGAIGLLQMKRNWVVNTCADASCLEVVLQFIPTLNSYHV